VNDEPYALTQCKTIDLEGFKRLNLNAYGMEPKVDGWRIQFEADPDGIRAWTRTNHDATGKMPRVEEVLKDMLVVYTNFRLDGECVYLDENGDPDFNFTSRCMGSGVDVCIDKQTVEARYLSYVVFDILRVGSTDLRSSSYEERREILCEEFEDLDPYLKVIPLEMPTLDQHGLNIEKFEEGSVLKQLNAPYAGKRHKSWLKMKETETIDVRITGYKMGQGKFKDLIGAITFRTADGTIGNCSGMDDETRVEITNHREALIGTAIEIKHYGRLVDGLRHPQFVRFRNE